MDNDLSIGIDIIEISRIRQAVDNYHNSFLNRVYTCPELDYCKSDPSRLAGRFAAKEATIKALKMESFPIRWRDIEILADEGKPVLKLHGFALEQASSRNIRNIEISLSHCREYAVAMAVALC